MISWVQAFNSNPAAYGLDPDAVAKVYNGLGANVSNEGDKVQTGLTTDNPQFDASAGMGFSTMQNGILNSSTPNAQPLGQYPAMH
jgi:hypothetical protein